METPYIILVKQCSAAVQFFAVVRASQRLTHSIIYNSKVKVESCVSYHVILCDDGTGRRTVLRL